MKRILGTLILAALWFSYSCSEDKDYKNDIIGKWSYERTMPCEVIASDAEIAKDIKKEFTNKEYIQDVLVLEFFRNGKGLITENLSYQEGSNTTEFFYTISDDDLILCMDKVDEEPGLEYYKLISLKDNKLTILFDDTEYYKDYYKNNYPTDINVTKVTATVEYKKLK